MKKIKHFNKSKFVYVTTKRQKIGKLSEKKQDKTRKYDYVLSYFCLYNAVHDNLVGGGEGLETAAIWFLPSCARKYLDPTGQSPCSHKLTMKISSSVFVNRFYCVL